MRRGEMGTEVVQTGPFFIEDEVVRSLGIAGEFVADAAFFLEGGGDGWLERLDERIALASHGFEAQDHDERLGGIGHGGGDLGSDRVIILAARRRGQIRGEQAQSQGGCGEQREGDHPVPFQIDEGNGKSGLVDVVSVTRGVWGRVHRRHP